MGRESFFGRNLVGQENWARRGADDAKLAGTVSQAYFDNAYNSLAARLDTAEAKLSLIQTGAWTNYTPTLAQGATNNIAKTVTYARYTKIGRAVTVQVYLDITGVGTAATAITASLPVPASASYPGLTPLGGWAFVYDASASQFYMALPYIGSTTVAAFMPLYTQVGLGWQNLGPGGGVAGGTFAAAFANTDIFGFALTYEAAS